MDYTDRGFGIIEGFESKYHGKIRVQESSNAMGPYLWIFTEKDPCGIQEPSIQLSLEEAKMLRYDLDKMIGHLKDCWEE